MVASNALLTLSHTLCSQGYYVTNIPQPNSSPLPSVTEKKLRALDPANLLPYYRTIWHKLCSPMLLVCACVLTCMHMHRPVSVPQCKSWKSIRSLPPSWCLFLRSPDTGAIFSQLGWNPPGPSNPLGLCLPQCWATSEPGTRDPNSVLLIAQGVLCPHFNHFKFTMMYTHKSSLLPKSFYP